jgi:uncharacterized membrane protein (DUF485 family)
LNEGRKYEKSKDEFTVKTSRISEEFSWDSFKIYTLRFLLFFSFMIVLIAADVGYIVARNTESNSVAFGVEIAVAFVKFMFVQIILPMMLTWCTDLEFRPEATTRFLSSLAILGTVATDYLTTLFTDPRCFGNWAFDHPTVTSIYT